MDSPDKYYYQCINKKHNFRCRNELNIYNTNVMINMILLTKGQEISSTKSAKHRIISDCLFLF